MTLSAWLILALSMGQMIANSNAEPSGSKPQPDLEQGPIQQIPSLDYLLIPLYDETQQAFALRTEIRLSGTNFEPQDVLIETPIEITKVDVGKFEGASVVAHDEDGPLHLVHETEPYGPPVVWQRWRVTRRTRGQITATYTALPRTVSPATRNAPSFELRQNFGGLLGSGFGFLATPPSSAGVPAWDTSVEWDLSGSPPGTRAVWTWGEGPHQVRKTLACSEIAATYFMVGNVGSYTNDGNFGLYWLGTVPLSTTELGSGLQRLFKGMSAFFEDDDEQHTYRVFIRYNPFRGSMAGTALRRSFMFSYDDNDRANPRSFHDYILFLSHEMVHNWVNFGTDEPLENWYPEGMAEYYSLVLALREGVLGHEEFLRGVNERLTMYYTNPLVNLSNTEVAKLTWSLSDAQRIPYGRGLLMALQADALIRKSTGSDGDGGDAHSIDDLVLALLRRIRSGDACGVSRYLSLLGGMIDGGLDGAKALYDNMVAGDMIIPPASSLSHLGLRPVRRDAPIWELGFDEKQAIQGDRVVRALVPGSAAERSGLQEGDLIVNSLAIDTAKMDPQVSLTVEVQRKGEHRTMSYVPRGKQMLQRWVYETVVNDSGGNSPDEL